MNVITRVALTFALFIFAFILMNSNVFTQNVLTNPTKSKDAKVSQALVDSIKRSIDIFERNNKVQRNSDSLTIEQKFLEQRKEYLDLFSTLTSLELANNHNIFASQEVIIGIIGLLLVVFGGAGKFYLDKYSNKLDKNNEIRLNETRVQYYLSLGQFTVARDLLERILELDKKNVFAHDSLGYLYLGDVLNQPEKAVVHNRMAIKLKPNSLFPYINLQIALDHAKYPLEDIERAYKTAIERARSVNADELTFGKAKLFFSGNLASLDPSRKPEAIRLVNEALDHFSKVKDPAKNRWVTQAQQALIDLQKP